jgi:hypothetical protein
LKPPIIAIMTFSTSFSTLEIKTLTCPMAPARRRSLAPHPRKGHAQPVNSDLEIQWRRTPHSGSHREEAWNSSASRPRRPSTHGATKWRKKEARTKPPLLVHTRFNLKSGQETDQHGFCFLQFCWDLVKKMTENYHICAQYVT